MLGVMLWELQSAVKRKDSVGCFTSAIALGALTVAIAGLFMIEWL